MFLLMNYQFVSELAEPSVSGLLTGGSPNSIV